MTSTSPKDFDEHLRQRPDAEKKAEAKRLIEGAKSYTAWHLARFFGNGAANKRGVELLDHAREDGLFELVAREKDKSVRSALVNDLVFRMALDIGVILEEVRRAGGEDLSKALATAHSEAAEIAGNSFREGPKLWRDQARIIWDWFVARGGKFFFDTQSARPLLFYDNGVHEVAASDTLLMGRFWALAGLNETQQATKFILAELKQRCAAEGARVAQHSWIHTDKLERRVFINMAAEDGTIIRLANGAVETIQNGINADDILLRKPLFMRPFKLITDSSGDAEALGDLGRLIYRNIATTRQDALFSICWATCAFLSGFTSVRPMIHFQGAQGSGKTGVAKLLWALLYGTDDFQGRFTMAALVASGGQAPFIVKDDLSADDMKPSLVQLFKATATGMGSTKRSSADESSVVSSASSALTALTGIQPFEAPDLRERIFNVVVSKAHQRGDWVESLALAEIMRRRDAILSALLRLLARDVIPAVDKHLAVVGWLRARYTKWSKGRMDEFTALVLLVARSLAVEIGHFGDAVDDVDEALFGVSSARVWKESGELRAYKDEPCDFDRFVRDQDALSKEFDVDSSPTLFWMQALARRLKPLATDKLFGAMVEDKELGLEGSVIAMGEGEQRWKGIAIRDSSAAILTAIMTLAKLRGMGAQVPYKSALSFSKSVQNEQDLLAANRIVVDYHVHKNGAGLRENLYQIGIEPWKENL